MIERIKYELWKLSSDAAGFPSKGRINAYVCDICQRIITTIDRHPGNTTFMLPCENPEHKAGNESGRSKSPTIFDKAAQADLVRMPDGSPVTMRTVAYAVPWTDDEGERIASVEFYRPGYDEYSKLQTRMRDYVDRGGLLWRNIQK